MSLLQWRSVDHEYRARFIEESCVSGDRMLFTVHAVCVNCGKSSTKKRTFQFLFVWCRLVSSSASIRHFKLPAFFWKNVSQDFQFALAIPQWSISVLLEQTEVSVHFPEFRRGFQPSVLPHRPLQTGAQWWAMWHLFTNYSCSWPFHKTAINDLPDYSSADTKEILPSGLLSSPTARNCIRTCVTKFSTPSVNSISYLSRSCPVLTNAKCDPT